MFFNNSELDQHIRRRPSVHVICLGAFLQQPMFVTDEVLAVPLSALGSGDLATLIGDYVSMDLDIHISKNEVEGFKQIWRYTYPGVVLVWHPINDASTQELKKSADISFGKAKRSIALITGDKFDVVCTIVLHKDGQEYELSPPISKRRQRTWLSNEDALIFQGCVVSLANKSVPGSRISLALQIYLDASNEESEAFRIVKFYNVLECLAAEHINKDVGSKDAVRKLLNVTYGQHWSVEYQGVQISFDLIAVAGSFRNALMHGSRIDKNKLAEKDRGVLDVICFEPFKISNALHQVVDNALWKIAAQKKN